jgi:hypothetical protein
MMKKRLLFACTLVLGFGIVATANYVQTNDKSDTNTKLVNNEGSESSTISNSSEQKYYQQIGINADFAKNYDKVADLTSDSELVAYGIVDKSKSFIDENRRIYTEFQFKTDEILKGKTSVDNSNLKVMIQGGAVSFAEYFKANEKIFKTKLSNEDFAKVQQDATVRGTELVQEIFEDVDNIKDGDKVLLFLSKDDEKNIYYVVGSSYYGLFSSDDMNKNFTREENAKSGRKIANISKDSLKKLITDTKDMSKDIKAAKKATNAANKNTEEIEKDNQYDIYK